MKETGNQKLMLKDGPMMKTGATSIEQISLNKIKLGKNSRLTVTDDEIAGLMQSIKETGLLQPIGVVKNGNAFEISYGNRRFMAVSKLGWTNIPAVVFENKTETEIDLQNLTENIQRRNISLTEAGRYIVLLKDGGLTAPEIAVRLGVSKNYIDTAYSAFMFVPKKFQKDMELRANNTRQKIPGKISLNAAQAIINAKKSYGLDVKQVETLFTAARDDEGFVTENIPNYAIAMQEGKKDPFRGADPVVSTTVVFTMKKSERDKLEKEHVINGPFRSLNALMVSILRGEKAVKVNMAGKILGKRGPQLRKGERLYLKK